MVESFQKGKKYLQWLTSALVLGLSASVFILQLCFAYDLEYFEYPILFSLLGLEGIATLLFLNSGLIFFSQKVLRRKPLLSRESKVSVVFVCLWAVFVLWLVDWIYVATPFTLPVQSWFDRNTATENVSLSDEVHALSSFVSGGARSRPNDLRVMLKRIRLNNPELYVRNGIAETIAKYSAKYNVDPVLVFFLNYIDSYYGNAVAGPLPFFDHVTGETFRDTIQVHLPTWVVESDVRKSLAQTPFFRKMLGSDMGIKDNGPDLGVKCNYLFHKLTLDVSLAPYALNIFSDVLLVMKEYPAEFPELGKSAPNNSLNEALRESYWAINSTALLRPYEEPYLPIPYSHKYYNAHRKDLKKFARAVYCKMMSDFDFATRVQVLLAKYNEKVITDRIGTDAWRGMAKSQRLALLAMPRDLFVPNVGHLGYNVYALPEINCTTIRFVAEEAKRDLAALVSSKGIWQPREPYKLWAGAGRRLRVFSEVWVAFYGEPLPGIKPTNTLRAVPYRKR